MSGMDFYFFLQTVTAVMIANAASVAFFFGAMKCSKLQKGGAANDELPLWVYACLIAPLGLAGLGALLIS